MKCLLLMFFIGCAVKCEEENPYYLVERPARRSPLKVYWNVPTKQCKSKRIPFDNLLEHYGIIQNENDAFRGDKISILYDPGLFPAIMTNGDKKYKYRNGGVPQEGDLKVHIDAFKKELNFSVLPDFSGVGVIDFESWRPIFRQNFGVLTPYKEMSYDIERENHPWWFESMVRAEGKRRFEASATRFMKQTLEVAKELRPKAKWGYYAYPYCFNMGQNDMETCSGQVRSENDAISWLWKHSTALFPSVYSSQSLSSKHLAALIRGRVAEAVRVRPYDQPILPYFWFKYRDGGFMNQDDLQTAIKVFYASEAAGFIIWGSSDDVNTPEKCTKLLNYIRHTLGPMIQPYTRDTNQSTRDTDTSNSNDNTHTHKTTPVLIENISKEKIHQKNDNNILQEDLDDGIPIQHENRHTLFFIAADKTNDMDAPFNDTNLDFVDTYDTWLINKKANKTIDFTTTTADKQILQDTTPSYEFNGLEILNNSDEDLDKANDVLKPVHISFSNVNSSDSFESEEFKNQTMIDKQTSNEATTATETTELITETPITEMPMTEMPIVETPVRKNIEKINNDFYNNNSSSEEDEIQKDALKKTIITSHITVNNLINTTEQPESLINILPASQEMESVEQSTTKYFDSTKDTSNFSDSLEKEEELQAAQITHKKKNRKKGLPKSKTTEKPTEVSILTMITEENETTTKMNDQLKPNKHLLRRLSKLENIQQKYESSSEDSYVILSPRASLNIKKDKHGKNAKKGHPKRRKFRKPIRSSKQEQEITSSTPKHIHFIDVTEVTYPEIKLKDFPKITNQTSKHEAEVVISALRVNRRKSKDTKKGNVKTKLIPHSTTEPINFTEPLPEESITTNVFIQSTTLSPMIKIKGWEPQHRRHHQHRSKDGKKGKARRRKYFKYLKLQNTTDQNTNKIPVIQKRDMIVARFKKFEQFGVTDKSEMSKVTTQPKTIEKEIIMEVFKNGHSEKINVSRVKVFLPTTTDKAQTEPTDNRSASSENETAENYQVSGTETLQPRYMFSLVVYFCAIYKCFCKLFGHCLNT